MSIKTIVLKGSWREMGRALGIKQKKATATVIERVRLTDGLRDLLGDQWDFLARVAPDGIEFLQWLCEGSAQSFEKLLAYLSWEYILFGREHCSTLLVKKSDGDVQVLHNEDESVGWRGKTFLVKCVPKIGVPFVGWQYAGGLPAANAGVNRHGFCVTQDDIWRASLKPRVGWPPAFVGFKLLQSRTWTDVERVWKTIKANAGMHFLIADAKRAMTMEFFHDVKDRRIVRPPFVHTNHALLAKTRLGSSASVGSKKRLARLEEIRTADDGLACMKTPIIKGGVFQSPTKSDDTMTLATVVLTPKKRQIDILSGKKKMMEKT